MNSMTLTSAPIHIIFKELHENFGGTLNASSIEHTLNLDNAIGKGHIRGIRCDGGFSYLEFDMMFVENFILNIKTLEKAPICFAYCSRGKVAHSFGDSSENNVLGNFQTGILTNAPFVNNNLYFTNGVQTKVSLIVVNTPQIEINQNTNNINYRIQELFLNGQPATNSIYLGSYNLKIADKIQQLEAISQDGIVRSLLIEGLIYFILALEIQQHTDDVRNNHRHSGSLTEEEMDLVCEVSKYIDNYPEQSLSIGELTRKSRLSPSKLQEGFKLMHGTTVSDYIRDVRLIKAEQLIKDTNLNISEIVYSIGFTSRSYFSKIFKLKYNCSPKQYKDKQKNIAVSA
jgi:AraC-like DNA-binding protein